ncbi:flagellar basal body P-ring protein FlgI, partial [Sphingomonas sp.]|uniref:flagellar basal body P-ring protein FlgI n=1 Tax=Sphingomonas sp. TaxID=28214 RepID=UPI0025897E5A
SQAFESVVDTVQESVESGLGALHVLINAANPDDFDVVNDAVIVVLDTAAMAGDIATDLMAEVFGAWKETFADSFAALADMIRRLYRQFSDFAPFFRAALRAVAATIADFAKTFRDLARFVLDQPDKIRTALERVLIPLFMAGASVFEADAAAAAIWEVLKDTGSVLSQRVNALALGLSLSSTAAATRIKDVARVDGVRANQLIGYGLVVGLDRTGDTQRATMTLQSLTAMLSRMGVRIDPNDIILRNVAAVMVTAQL